MLLYHLFFFKNNILFAFKSGILYFDQKKKESGGYL